MPWIYAHLLGDFVFQNDWMQRKSKSSLHCTAHVLMYMLPYLLTYLSVWQLLLIGVQHWLQDRFDLAAVWQREWRQSPPDKWPQGRLLVDQTFHIIFVALIASF